MFLYKGFYSMIFRSKIFVFFVLFISCLSANDQSAVSAVSELQLCKLDRVIIPNDELVDQQVQAADARVFKKYVVTSTVIVASLVSLYLLSYIRDAAIVNEAALSKMHFIPKDIDAAKVPEVLKLTESAPGWTSWGLHRFKNFGLGFGKLFADSGLMLASGLIVQGAYSYAANKWNQVYTEETVLWYAYEQTKIPNLFNDLKLYATDYDLYASLLSAELFNQDAKIQMKAFVKDLIGSAQNYMGNDLFQDASYFECLLVDIKKKYIQKGKELAKLEEFVVPAVAKRKRALAQEHATTLFSKDMNRRADIESMCNMFAEEMQKLLAFIQMRGGLRYKARVADMVDACNAFLEHMERLLNSTPEQLQELSKNDCGMFTSVYEYEQLFSEQINFLHRYCKLNS